VVTIVGEGGIGKTALALKVAYEILDLPDCPFEAIVWSTSKTTTLTAQEIVIIEGAICDSLGMFQSVAKELAGIETKNALDEVLNYLAEFRILLVMDNLETVMDDRIRGFLQRLPMGSKILITSRVGLGSFEYPVKLQPLDEGDAIQLLRALARARGVPELVKVNNRQLTAYCHRMKNNPGYIKWFVSAVQTGRRPEDVLSNPGMFLEFCMSNVYVYISEGSRKVLRSMLCLPGKRSQAELAYLNEIEAIDLQRALQELLTTNMVTMFSVPSGSSYESFYDLGELARAYLLKHHPIGSEELKRLNYRRNRLTAIREQIEADLGSDPYSFFSVRIRSKNDVIVVKYLKDALTEARRKGFEAAEALVEKARTLAPDYFEVHRVKAQIQAMQNNHPAALASYEAAIELEPKSAPLRKWYGSFLMRFMGDTASALEQFKIAAKLDPSSFEIQLEFASAHLYTREFAEAEALLKSLLKREEGSVWQMTKVNDLQLQFFQRKADYLETHHDYGGALDCLKELRRFHAACKPAHTDLKMNTKFAKAIPTARSCVRHIGDPALNLQAKELLGWLEQVGWARQSKSETEGPTLFGRVSSLPEHREYGFIKSDEGAEFFFHFNKVTKQAEITRLKVGARVSFVMGMNSGGQCAVNVSLVTS
jgi:Tfp pilus assembly protein PilF/cold shock CspA family protein